MTIKKDSFLFPERVGRENNYSEWILSGQGGPVDLPGVPKVVLALLDASNLMTKFKQQTGNVFKICLL